MIRIALVWILLIQQSLSVPGIRGAVTVAGTNEPIAGARVILTELPALPGTPPPAITDSNGYFTFRDLPIGKYQLTFVKDGFLLARRDIQLVAGKDSREILVQLTLGGTVSGRVRNPFGRPLANVPVQLLKRTYSAAGVRYEAVERGQTNDSGEYRMFWVEPGHYYLSAGSDGDNGYNLVEPFTFEDLIRRGDNSVPGTYPKTYFPGVATADKATVLEIQAGAEMTGIDVTVSRQQRHRIRGRVVDPRTGMPPNNLIFESPASRFGNSYTYDESTGSFEITGLVPGPFWFMFLTEDPDRRQAETTLLVGDSDVEGLVLNLLPMPVVHGHIKVEGELPADYGLDNIGIELRPMSSENRSTPSSAVQPDGKFTLDELDKREFRIALSGLPSGFYLKEARLNGTDVLHAFASFLQSGELEIIVGSKTGKLQGTLSAAPSVNKSDVQVVLIPNASRFRTETYMSATPDKDGRFSIVGVAPGDYKVFAWDRLEPWAWFDPELLKEYEDLGTAIRVEESSTQNIELKVILVGGTK